MVTYVKCKQPLDSVAKSMRDDLLATPLQKAGFQTISHPIPCFFPKESLKRGSVTPESRCKKAP